MKTKLRRRTRTYNGETISKKGYLITGIIVTLLVSSGIVYLFNQSTVAGFTHVSDSSDESDKGIHKSDNPILYLPVAEEKWLPIALPEPVGRPLDEDAEQDIEILIYDIKTKETKTILKSFTKSEQTTLKLPGNQGSLPSEPIPGSAIGYGDRTRITLTTDYPWRTITKLRMVFPSGNYMGSGFIIDDYHILTAGHCVYNPELDEWATSIEVIPARDGDYNPFYHAWATNMTINSNWLNYGYYQDDFAIITLDRNVGSFTGWMGLEYAEPSDSIYTGILNTAGYPGDLDNGGNMYFDSDFGTEADEYNHWYWMDTRPGQSGSPVWFYNGIDYNVLSIVTYETPPQDPNYGTRLSEDWFDLITNVRDEHISPIDYANLIDDGQDYSGFDPVTITAGVSYFDVWSDIRNIGTANASNFYVSYYASIDAEITTSDYLIGIDEVNSITPFMWANSDWSGTFPTIPAGTYYVGWIIDSTDIVPEQLDEGEGNNIAYKESYQLLVTRAPEEETYTASIIGVVSPSEVYIGGSFTVNVTVSYEFTDPTMIWPGIYDVENVTWIAEDSETLVGEGTKTYNFDLTAPDEETTWTLEASVWYYLEDGWTHNEEEYSDAFEISVITRVYEFSIDYVSADTVEYDDTLTVTGSGVTPGSEVEIYWDYIRPGNLLNTTEGDPDGTYLVWIDVPSDIVGPHYLWALDTSTDDSTWYGPITMVPKITSSQYWGVPGEEITIRGYGFSFDEDVILTLGGVHIGNFVTNNIGEFSGTFIVPPLAFEVYELIAEQPSHGVSVEINFNVRLILVIISPASGEADTTIVVTGTGFTPSGNFMVVFSGLFSGDIVSEVVFIGDISADGAIMLEVVFPFSNPGEYNITVLDIDTGIFLEIEYEVLSDPNTYEIPLFMGWNLVGLPFTPVDPSIDVVLADILDNVESVWAYDGDSKTWSSYSPGAPSDLDEMVEGRGYWIKMNADALLTIYGESE